MPYFEDSYQTTVGSALITTPIVNRLRVSMAQDGLDRVSLDVQKSGDTSAAFVLGQTSSEADIPPFSHPIVVLTPRQEKVLCTDMRFYVTKSIDSENFEDSIRNRTEYNFAKSRSILNLLWITGRGSELKNSLQFAGVVYAELISQAIARNYSLDFRDKTAVSIATHFFYQALFTTDTEFDEEARQKMAVHTIKATKAPSEMVTEVFNKIGAISNIRDYCKMVSEVTESVRLKDFNLAILLTIMKNSWFGTNAKEIITVALEHPPTWCAIVYSALTERTFKNSSVANMAVAHGKRGASDEFEKNYVNLIRGQIERRAVSRVLEELNDLAKVSFE